MHYIKYFSYTKAQYLLIGIYSFQSRIHPLGTRDLTYLRYFRIDSIITTKLHAFSQALNKIPFVKILRVPIIINLLLSRFPNIRGFDLFWFRNKLCLAAIGSKNVLLFYCWYCFYFKKKYAQSTKLK